MTADGMLAPVDFAWLAGYVVWSVWAGMRARRAAPKNLEQYFLAGRTLPGWQAGVSMAATQFAADRPPLVTGLVATGGVFALWRLSFLLWHAWLPAALYDSRS